MSGPTPGDLPDLGLRLPVAGLPDSGKVIPIDLGETARKALATYLDIIAVNSAKGEIRIRPWRGKGMRLEGAVTATLTQQCVVSLEPMETRAESVFVRKYLPPSMIQADEAKVPGDLTVDPLEEDPPEPLPAEIDLGAIIAEELALAVDPYPRRPDVAFSWEEGAVAPADEDVYRPFEALKILKDKGKSGS